MQNVLLFWLAVGGLSGTLYGAGPSLLTPLASISTPPCSKRPGVRAVQSGLVQFGRLTASLSAQSVREKETCTQSAALWITQKDVSQQFDLPGTGTGAHAILDVAPDSSAILLSSVATLPDIDAPRVAVVSLADGAFKWSPVSEMLAFKSCDAVLMPQGFLDAKHIEIAVAPLTAVHRHTSCTKKVELYSVDLDIPRVKSLRSNGVDRLATTVTGPARSCKTDPDVVGACYTTRARLGLDSTGGDLLLWPLGSAHYMATEEQMIPSALRSEITPDMRVYATMVLCPLLVEHRGPRLYVCVESATDIRPDPISPKNSRTSARIRH